MGASNSTHKIGACAPSVAILIIVGRDTMGRLGGRNFRLREILDCRVTISDAMAKRTSRFTPERQIGSAIPLMEVIMIVD